MLLGLVVLFKFPKNSFNHLPRQISSHERVSPEELPNTSRPKFPKALKITSLTKTHSDAVEWEKTTKA